MFAPRNAGQVRSRATSPERGGRPECGTAGSVLAGGGPFRASLHRAGLLAILSVLLAGGCSRPLPEPESEAARFYDMRCAGCHRTYHPGIMTKAMWRFQVDRMDQKYRESGMVVPTAEEKEKILDYLLRFAGR